MKLVNLAVKRPVTIVIVVSVLIILGFFTLSKMAVDLFPEMKLPVAAVMTSYPGAGPEEVEQVSKVLESSVATVANVKEIQSQSLSGSSVLIVYFNWGTDMDQATIDIREKIGLVENFLPDEVEKPMVIKMDPTMAPILQMGISGADNPAELQSIAEDIIKPRLSRIPEIASVTITGGKIREIKVEVDPVKLDNYGLTMSQVNQVLQAENFNMTGGKVEEGGREYYVRNLQEFESVEDIKQVAIVSAQGNTVYLSDIASVIDGYKEDTQLTKVDGEYAVGIHCMKGSDANTVLACEAVKQEMQDIQKELGIKLNVKMVYDASDYINKSLQTTERMIVEGALLAVLILFLFLRNGRSTLIVFTSIPLSIITTFIVMYFTDYTLNLITMSGLALGVGRIVDDSIVVFENIYRHRSLGESPLQAAINGASEVGMAVIAATLTLIAVFLPIVTVEGIASIIFKPMAMTICFAVLCSLVVALTVIPLMSSRMLTDKSMQAMTSGTGRLSSYSRRFGQWIDNLGERYKEILKRALKRKRLVIIITTVLMIASIAATPLIGAEFLPKMDSGEISITVETDKGSELSNTTAVVEQIEKHLRQIPEVDTIFSSIGSGGNMMLDSSTQADQGAIYVKLCSKGERDRSVDTVAEEIRDKVIDIAGAKITVKVTDMASQMSAGGAIAVKIKGDDLDVLRDLSDQVAGIMRKVPGTREVSSSLTDGNPELQIKIDRRRAATYGLTPMQISSEIANAMQGKVATRYKVEGEEVDVRVRYIPQGHKDIEYLTNLNIMSSSGAVVKLSQVATFEMAQGPVKIVRTDQVRQAEITADLLNRDLNSVMQDIQTQVGKINLPAGYEIEYGGQNEDMMESFSSLAIALVLAMILVYAVMAIQYESFFNPFVIMFSVPTALIGVVLGLLITGRSFSVPAFIGLIMLVGITVSNAIVFVDYLKQLREKGVERDEAIIETGRVRLRPILMTAFATILAMLPLATGLGEGSEQQAPLATVVIGGLLVSTLITLVLVPVVYCIFDDWGQKLGRRFKFGRQEVPQEAGIDTQA
ncbi:MAG: efflux RND transporter permease subunit [Syntrophomonadaceae bacterium]|jgi:HAE1 family hydrophobic/amphiphilic exporter-1